MNIVLSKINTLEITSVVCYEGLPGKTVPSKVHKLVWRSDIVFGHVYVAVEVRMQKS